MDQIPIKLIEKCQLQALNIPLKWIGFNSLTVDSDKYICIWDPTAPKSELTVVDISNIAKTSKYACKADSARINPQTKIIALKAGLKMVVYNYDSGALIKDYTSTEEIIYWRWISADMIAIITTTSVYHWSIKDEPKAPVLIFEHGTKPPESQIISYKTDSTFKWCALISIMAENSRVVGSIQISCTDIKGVQKIEGHACCFMDFQSSENPHPTKLFCFALRSTDSMVLFIQEAGPPLQGNQPFLPQRIKMHPNQNNELDFPIALHTNKKCGILSILTRNGYIHLFDVQTKDFIFVNHMVQDTVLASADMAVDEGFVFITRSGYVRTVVVNKDSIIPYLFSVNKTESALSVSLKSGYPGSENVLLTKFNEYFKLGKYLEAAKIAAKTQSPLIRNADTIARFRAQSLPDAGGAPRTGQLPIIAYFNAIMDSGKLNQLESMEICNIAFLQNKIDFIESSLRKDQLECTKELGDLARPHSLKLAASIYLRANCPDKVVECFAEAGDYDTIVKYCQKVNYIPDYTRIVRSIILKSPELALKFCLSVLQTSPDGLDVTDIAKCFMEVNQVQPCLTFLSEALKGDLPEQAELQTKFFEMALSFNPQIADTLFAQKTYTHFDRVRIGKACEGVGLIQRALEFYTDIYDIKRAIVQTERMNPEWLVTYFGSLSIDNCLICLKTLLAYNLRQNLLIVVKVSSKYHDLLGTPVLMDIFESVKSAEGMFMFLHEIVRKSQDPEVHLKYIQAAYKTSHFNEVERICRESDFYDPVKVKNFLLECKLNDPTPLIIVCDRFNYVQELVHHLNKSDMLKHVETFVLKVNPKRLPEVVGILLDLNCREEFIRNMMMSCLVTYSMESLVEEVSKRNRIKMIRPLLEYILSTDSKDPSVHSALAVVYVESNNQPEVFLKENNYYDTVYVGKYCEKRDPKLACIAYEKGCNDQLLIDVCYKNGLFKNLSRYAINRKDPSLWRKLLDPTNDYRRSFIDQTSKSALSENFETEAISVMVKSFIDMELSRELIDLLEKIVLTDSSYRPHKSLQNLLLLTAIKTDPSRLLDYINRLDNYDAAEIANVAIHSNLYEEAFTIHKKLDSHPAAIQILTDYIKNIDRAYEYAERCNIPAVWSILAKAQLSNNLIKEAIDSFLKSEDHTCFREVISSASGQPIHEALLKYLIMIRKQVRDPIVDSEYAYCLAYTDRYEQLVDFLNHPQNIESMHVGDRLFEDEKYEACKLLYKYANNFMKLALTHVKLNEFQQAIEMAHKAGNTKMWKVVGQACLSAGEYRFARICAMNLVVHPEELPELIASYEEIGKFEELISLIEASVNLERAHIGIFTELSILFAKYKPSKLRDHLELYWNRMNLPKVIAAATANHLWAEVVYLHDKYEEYDSAILCMIQHPSIAFHEAQFRDIIQKVNNQEVHYKAINFYCEYKPLMLNELMIAISSRVDNTKAINMLKSLDVLPICKSYLLVVQKLNLPIINESLNEIYIEEECYEDLRSSIENYNNYDASKLAKELENHPSVEFRRISILIRKLSNRWGQTLEMAKKDCLFGDAILYAAESRDSEIAQNLLEYFISINRPDQILCHLYFCYDILKPDQVLEACWISDMTNVCMPFMIQFVKDYSSKVDTLEQKPAANESQDNNQAQFITHGSGQLMIGAGPVGGMSGSYSSQDHGFNRTTYSSPYL
ncbi:Clathrin heavy chain 1 [Thelohanellus kitauei]|uniref:Clathrin heavy chain n=1 Tax=Thelohanellus kitauei TaxID=669202 RepID=A0A0C2J9A3_THEKT|nr:Clathrin heavy chain 1 [Thelohanellus kitauei]